MRGAPSSPLVKKGATTFERGCEFFGASGFSVGAGITGDDVGSSGEFSRPHVPRCWRIICRNVLPAGTAVFSLKSRFLVCPGSLWTHGDSGRANSHAHPAHRSGALASLAAPRGAIAGGPSSESSRLTQSTLVTNFTTDVNGSSESLHKQMEQRRRASHDLAFARPRLAFARPRLAFARPRLA
jgi:hypothetical protein